jgi:hypothetical protein
MSGQKGSKLNPLKKISKAERAEHQTQDYLVVRCTDHYAKEVVIKKTS